MTPDPRPWVTRAPRASAPKVALALLVLLACAGALCACAAAGDEGELNAGADAPELVAYAVKVGYRGEGAGTTTIASKAEWDEFVESMASVVYDGAGNELREPVEGLKGYDEAFFRAGNTLAVAYADLGSSGYDPTVTNVSLDGGVATIACDLGIEPGTLYTTDLGGFVAVVEVPAGTTVTSARIELAD